MTPILPLPSNLPGQDTPADRLVAAKANELVDVVNAAVTTIAANEAEASQSHAEVTKSLADFADVVERTLTNLETLTAELTTRVTKLETPEPPPPPPPPPPANVASVSVTVMPTSIVVGGTGTVTVTAKDEAGAILTGRETVITCIPPTVATLAGNVITAVSPGNATVLASVDGVVGSAASFIVLALPPDPWKPPPPDPIVVGWTAELPRVQVDVRYVAATGRTWEARTDGELRTALAAYNDGDEIVLLLAAPLVCTAPYVADRPGRVTIRGPTIPPAGKRVTPVTGVTFPKVRTAIANSVFAARNGASLRLLGLDIGAVPELLVAYTLVSFGEGNETALNQLPVNCVVDRCLIVGHDKLDARRGIGMHGVGCAVVDSWINVHSLNDAAAIWGWNGPGPYGAYNTRLESSGENWMFGGADPKIAGVVPSDVTLDRCHILKNYDLVTGQSKNFGEAKNVRRLLQSACVVEGIGTPRSTQPGYAVVLSATDQERLAPWSVVEDVTIRWCEYRNIMGFLNATGWVFDAARFWTRRVSVQDCLIRKLAPALDAGVLFQQHTEGVEVIRTTFEQAGYPFVFEARVKLDGGLKGIRIIDNAASASVPYLIPDSVAAFDQYAPGRIVTGNEFTGYGSPAPTIKGVDRAALAAKLANVVVAP